MPPTRRQFLGTAAITTAFAGCLGSTDSSDTDTTTTTSTTTEHADATVSVRSTNDLGDVLVGPDGMTLYMFVPDDGADGSTCTGDCAAAWPPLTIEGTPTAGSSVSASLSTITRDDGSQQVVAGSWPLYYYAGDDNPGDVNGQGVNDVWYVLRPDGTPRRPQTTAATTTSEPTTQPATVEVRSHPDLGDILVGPDGMTLYMFDNDTRGSDTSSCSSGCASSWPPLTIDGEPSAGMDVTAGLSTFQRGDDTTQVTANGWPLYYFSADASPGDANGQGVSDVWYVLRPDGTPVRDTPQTTTEDDGGLY